MSERAAELLHGTLVALILRTLAGGRRHGYAIARAIEDATEGVVQVEDGSLYPALYRMERKGWIEAEWGTSEILQADAARTPAVERRNGGMDAVRRGDLARAEARMKGHRPR